MPRGVPLQAPAGRPGSRSPGASARASAVRAIDNSLHARAHITSAPQGGGASSQKGPASAITKGPTPNRYALWSGAPANAGPSNAALSPDSPEFPVAALKEWVASHNLEISRTHPDREGSAWDYIGHRLPREKSPGTAVHSTVLTEGKWAVEFKILECKGNSGNGMYLGVTDGGASLTQEKGGRAWVLDLNEGKLRTFQDGFNIGCNGVGMSGRKLMRGDMKCVCKGAKVRLLAAPSSPPGPFPLALALALTLALTLARARARARAPTLTLTPQPHAATTSPSPNTNPRVSPHANKRCAHSLRRLTLPDLFRAGHAPPLPGGGSRPHGQGARRQPHARQGRAASVCPPGGGSLPRARRRAVRRTDQAGDG